MARRIGIEIEFSAVSPAQAMALLVAEYGGTPRWAHSRHGELDVGAGTFKVELDSSFFNRITQSLEAPDNTGRPSPGAQTLSDLIGDMAALVVPCEITTPPLPVTEIERFDQVVAGLRRAGAEGTSSSWLNAFALQLNPEVLEPDVATILPTLQAYLTCQPWLESIVSMDPVRRLLGYAEPFPARYVDRICTPAYRPTLAQMIADYLEDNPTRNRELDLLPLFRHLAPDHPDPALSHHLIKPRPTFHWRRPDCHVDRPGWTVSTEWRRWQTIEFLAADPVRLGEAMVEFRSHLRDQRLEQWPARLKPYLA